MKSRITSNLNRSFRISSYFYGAFLFCFNDTWAAMDSKSLCKSLWWVDQILLRVVWTWVSMEKTKKKAEAFSDRMSTRTFSSAFLRWSSSLWSCGKLLSLCTWWNRGLFRLMVSSSCLVVVLSSSSSANSTSQWRLFFVFQLLVSLQPATLWIKSRNPLLSRRTTARFYIRSNKRKMHVSLDSFT